MEDFKKIKFKNPEDEIRFLREQIAFKEKELKERGKEVLIESIVEEKVSEYKKFPSETILETDYKLAHKSIEGIILDLAPEPHDKQMEELLGLLEQNGIKNAISVVEKMNNPHITDDFQRLLVQYVKKVAWGGKKEEKIPEFKSLNMTLYEITLPEEEQKEKGGQLKELISKMEQFYAGMSSVKTMDSRENDFFSIEISNSNFSGETIFYVAIPDSKAELFEKQIFSIFPNAKIKEKKDDYNIFNENGISVGSYAFLEQNSVFPIKTYEQFDYDPLNIILNAFSKINLNGEGAAIQMFFKPVGEKYTKNYKSIFEKIKKGVSVKEATKGEGFFQQFFEIGKEIVGLKDEKKEKEEKIPDQTAIENIEQKIGSSMFDTEIRILASSNNRVSAEEILSHLEAAFNQFENTQGNKISFKRVVEKKLPAFEKDFSFRIFREKLKLPLNIKEITSLIHFPQFAIESSELKRAKAGSAPALIGMPSSGVLLGVNKHRNTETKIYMGIEDRLRHFYVIGQTGTGKTTLLKNMIAQDIADGKGVCMIDPHGTDIQDILGVIPPERYEDVIYFDPSYIARPMALNMLEYDTRYPEQKTFVVNEMLSIFNKLFDMKTAGGPMFEQYFRNSVLLVMDDPESGNTLLDVGRVLADKSFREFKLSKCKNPIVVQFWREVAEKAGGEASLQNIVPYITSKFDIFLSNDIMRPIISQEKSSFQFREIIDNKKILLVNLSKGRLGDINANLIGLILVGKIFMAALSRVDLVGKEMQPFYLYIDEFQNITSSSIASILSEARKYKLSLNIAHQFIAQIEEGIKDAVFGNVGSIACFRVGADDAEFLEKQFAPTFTIRDIMNLDNRNAYLKLLVDGKTVKPFNIETLSPPVGRSEIIDKIKKLSYLKFGREREDVEEEIMKKYLK